MKIEKLLNLIFPQVCGICEKITPKLLCNKCKILLEKEKYFNIDDYSQDNTNYFDEHIYLFKYQGLIREKIIEYKFNERAYLYKTFVNFWLNDKNTCRIFSNYDIIIPFPISKNRYKQRGYNQSELLAREIARNTKLKLEKNCLYKNKDIVEQSKLNKEERIENIKNVYLIKNVKGLENKKILIIDDIYTTGSTVNECSKVLKNAEIQKIGILTIAKD